MTWSRMRCCSADSGGSDSADVACRATIVGLAECDTLHVCLPCQSALCAPRTSSSQCHAHSGSYAPQKTRLISSSHD